MNEDSEALRLAAEALDLLAEATRLATTARERRVLALVTAHLAGETDRVTVLARDHLIDHPDDELVTRLLKETS